MTQETIYKAIKESPISNIVVAELNASVLTATFPGKGTFLADLYSNVHSSDNLVYHGSCAPIHGKFVKTVTINI